MRSFCSFSKFEVETSSSGYSEQVQAKATGLLEGYLMWKSIHQIWQNTIGDYCKFNGDKCSLIRGYLIDNKNWILEQVEQHQNQTDYTQWKQVCCLRVRFAIFSIFNRLRICNRKKYMCNFYWSLLRTYMTTR